MGQNPISVSGSSYATKILRTAIEEAARELRPFDAEAFRRRNVDYVSVEPDEQEEGER